MTRTQPPVPPRKSGASRAAVFGICTTIGLCTIGLSGAASYFAAREGMLSTTQVSQETSPVINEINQSEHSNQIQVLDVSGIVARLRPSVVEISTESYSNGNSIFGQYVSQGAGSGVIISQDGYIVTNNHVVEGADSITVKTMDGVEYPAQLIGTDAQTDIAVIKIDATDLQPAEFGNSDEIQVGQAAIAIGNPLGSLGGTVTTGIISAVGREITIDNETMTLLQTDAAINPGNSGGGLFDVNGKLIGIVNAKQAETGIEGLGFAIPISDVTGVIDDLVSHGHVTSRPLLNVSLQDIAENSYYTQNGREPGVYLVQIIEGGSADQAGLQVGDRIVSFDGQTISSSSQLKKILRSHAIGDEVSMVIDRDGTEQEVTIHLLGPDE